MKLANKLLLVSVLLVAAGSLSAQTVWTGTTSNAWNVAGNWAPPTVPTATDDVSIPAAPGTQPTLSAPATCRHLTIEAGATLTGGAGALSILGNFICNGTYVPGTASVNFTGDQPVTIGGAASTITIYSLWVNKNLRAVTVTMLTNVVVTNPTLGTAANSCAIDVQTGTFVTNGFNFTATAPARLHGGAQGEFKVTPGTPPTPTGGLITLNSIYGWNLGYMSVNGGTVNINGLHEVVNSGHRFDLNGGTVNWNLAGAVTCLQLYTNNNGWGYFQTGGIANFFGSINTNIGVYVTCTGGVMNFVGNAASTIRLCSSLWNFPDTRFLKTGGQGVTFIAGQDACPSNVTFIAATIETTSSLTCGGNFSVPTFGFQFGILINLGLLNFANYATFFTGNVDNAGTITPGTSLSQFNGTTVLTGSAADFYDVQINATRTLTCNGVMRVARNWTNSGTFTSTTGTVTFINASAIATITGNSTFNNFTCTTPTKQLTFTAGSTQTINGVLTLNGTAQATAVILRSTAVGLRFNIADNGTENVQATDVRDSQASNLIVDTPNGVDSGNNVNWSFVAPDLNVDATAGVAQPASASSTGPGGNGIVGGVFRVFNNNALTGYDLTSLTIQALGTANDQTAYTQVSVVEDTNNNSVYDFGQDVVYGSPAFAFPADNGSLSFAGVLPIAAAAQRRFFIVVKLNGSPLPLHGQTLQYRVATATGTSLYFGGIPSATMNGLIAQGPLLTVSVTAGAAQNVLATTLGPANNGLAARGFSITNNAEAAASLTSISITASGSGNDAQAYTQVALFEDADQNSAFDIAIDTPYGAAATAFPVDNGVLTFIAVHAFAVSQQRAYFIVVKLNGSTLAINAQTFDYMVSAITVNAGTVTAGTPSANMPGLIIQGPVLTVAATVGVAQLVLPTQQGPGATTTGIQAGVFTITNSAVLATTLNSITVAASGTGLDNTAYTSVQLFEDTNNTSAFETVGDTQVGGTFPAFPAENGSLTFTAAGALGAYAVSQSKRYFIVVKLNGSPLPTNGLTFQYTINSIAFVAGATFAGTPSATMVGLQINGPVLTVAATAGTAVLAFADSLGALNQGIMAGVFTITNNNSITGTMNTLTIASGGTGNSSTAYTEVRLIEDTNNNSVFDFVGDTQVGATAAAFTAGSIVFTPTVAQGTFGVLVSKRYFIVAKLNGTPLAAPGQTLTYTVSGLAPGQATINGGVPSGTMNGITIQTPSFAVVDGAAPLVTGYRGQGNFVLQKFTATYPAGPANSITSITIAAGGTGNDLANYASVKLFFDSNTNGVYDIGGDTLVGSLSAFSADNGTAVFTPSGAASTFVATGTKTYFVVGEFNNTPIHGATFQTRVQLAVTGYAGTTFTPALPAPTTGYSNGAVVNLPQYLVADNSNPAVVNAFLGDPGFTLQAFTVTYSVGPNNVLTSMTAISSGTGNDLTDFAAVRLVLDDPVVGTQGSFDPADLVVDSKLGFSANDGPVTFTLAGPASQFIANQVKQFFIIADFNDLGINGTSFSSAVTAVGGGNFGATSAGLPIGPTAGLNLLDAHVRASLNGPGFAVTVNSNDQGVNEEGLLISDVTLATGPGSDWSIDQLTFVGSGTANHNTAYADIWLYEDDGNGIWDGPAVDAPAASPVTSFNAGTNDASFALLNTATGVNSIRRFFLLGRLSGAAVTGQTLNARLDSVNGSPDVGGSVKGTPTLNSTALMIEATALTVLSGPSTPLDLLRKSGSALTHPILNLRMAASNDNVSVNGITFSNAGTGNFAGDLAAGTGFEVYLDDGDGVFTGADTLLYQGAGANAVSATFSPALSVPNSGTRDLWVVLNALDSAGAGSAVPLTYQSLVGAAGDVDVAGGAIVLLGTPAPQSNLLRIVDFFVSNFDPVADTPAGGKDITITGSGFMSPVVVKIDGILCPGAAVINGGTQITGLEVPPGTGLDRPISIKSGNLPDETITQTFDYVPVIANTPSDSSGCAGSGSASWWPALLVLAAILPITRRLRRRV